MKRALATTWYVRPLIVVLIFLGCSDVTEPLIGPGTEEPVMPTESLVGKAALDLALVGVDIAVHDTDGLLIGLSRNATNSTGGFAVQMPPLPGDFRVLADPRNGGTIYTADVRAYTPGEVVYVNLVTTLVSRHLDRNPGVSVDEARQAVRGHLGIPDFVNIGSDITGKDSPHFSHVTFMERAQQHGGTEPFFAKLLDEIDQGATSQHTFPSQLAQAFVIDDILIAMASAVAGELAKRATDYVLDDVLHVDDHLVEWGLKKPDPTQTKLDNIEYTQELLKEKMDQLLGLTEVLLESSIHQTEMLTDIENKLDRLESSIQQAKVEILEAVDRSIYEAKINTVSGAISNIQDLNSTYRFAVEQIAQASKQYVDGDISRIEYGQYITDYRKIVERVIDRIEGDLESDLRLIHNTLVGLSESEGLLGAWRGYLEKRGRFSTTYEHEIHAQAGAFLGWQTMGTNLLIEAAKASYSDLVAEGLIERYRSDLKKNMVAQLAVYGLSLDTVTADIQATGDRVIVDNTTGLFWYDHQVCPDGGCKPTGVQNPWGRTQWLLAQCEDVTAGGKDNWFKPTWDDVQALALGLEGTVVDGLKEHNFTHPGLYVDPVWDTDGIRTYWRISFWTRTPGPYGGDGLMVADFNTQPRALDWSFGSLSSAAKPASIMCVAH